MPRFITRSTRKYSTSSGRILQKVAPKSLRTLSRVCDNLSSVHPKVCLKYDILYIHLIWTKMSIDDALVQVQGRDCAQGINSVNVIIEKSPLEYLRVSKDFNPILLPLEGQSLQLLLNVVESQLKYVLNPAFASVQSSIYQHQFLPS